MSDELRLFAERAGHTSESTTTLPQVPDPHGRGVASSSEVLKRLRHSCTNTAHVVTVILANSLTHGLFAAMTAFVDVVRRYHGEAMKISKCPETTMQHRILVAKGGWTQELLDIVAICKDPKAMASARFLTPNEPEEPWPWQVDQDDYIADRIHLFVTHLLAQRVLHSSCLSHSFPWKLAGLLTQDEGDLAVHLDDLKTWSATLRILDEAAIRSSEAARFRQELVWPLWPWVREVLLQLEEHSFKQDLSGKPCG